MLLEGTNRFFFSKIKRIHPKVIENRISHKTTGFVVIILPHFPLIWLYQLLNKFELWQYGLFVKDLKELYKVIQNLLLRYSPLFPLKLNNNIFHYFP